MKRRKFITGAMASLPLTMLRKESFIDVPNNQGFKVKANEARFGKRFKMKGVTLNILDTKISGKDTDGKLAVLEQTGLTPNGGPPLHIHPNQDEMFFCIEGDYKFQVGEELFSIQAGETIFLPRNVKHAFIQLSEKARMIVSYWPAGKMEEFFRYTDAWTTPPSKEEVDHAFKIHDMIVVGPPLKA